MSTNPFAAPQTSPYPQSSTPAFKPIERLEYMRMYNYVFENPNWVMNVLLTAVCTLIPVIGPLVLMGYQYEVMIALLMSGGARYPDFDFNRFADYLIRGLWPFLVGLVASLVLVPLMMVLFIPMMLLFVGAANAGQDAGPFVVLIGMPILVLLNLAIVIVFQMVLLPLQLRAGLAQDFGVAFNFQWIVNFAKKTWLEMVLGLLFVTFSYLVLAMLGFLVFCVGVYAAVALFVLAQAHLLYQLYLLFLSRGGEPVQIKMSPAK
ncbi:MAG TPA: DUF4013 domain-containing protein [Pirellulaceae bacterium]|nr:DUF4013 domain-containing protein [Pirellulaceae bacterium]